MTRKILISFVSLALAFTAVQAQPTTVTVNPKTVVSTDLMGFGVRWSPYPKAKRTLSAMDLEMGLALSLPQRSVILLTTME